MKLFEVCLSESLQASHLLSLSCGRGVSQSESSEVSSLRRALPWTVTGASRPRGKSKTLLTGERTPRRVNGLFMVDAEKVKVSDVISQSRPRLRCVGAVSPLRSKSLITGAQSSGGKASMTA